jgi:hypothetical protein
MNFDIKFQVAKTAADLFELINVEKTRSEEEHARLLKNAVDDILVRHPDFDVVSMAFAQGVAVGRCQARQQCGCIAGTKPDKTRT